MSTSFLSHTYHNRSRISHFLVNISFSSYNLVFQHFFTSACALRCSRRGCPMTWTSFMFLLVFMSLKSQPSLYSPCVALRSRLSDLPEVLRHVLMLYDIIDYSGSEFFCVLNCIWRCVNLHTHHHRLYENYPPNYCSYSA